jgi:hypothetical protein
MSDSTCETGADDVRRRAGEGVATGLDDLLRAVVLGASDKVGETWAERIILSLVRAAASGDARSQHEIFQRIGAAPKSDRSIETVAIDDATARKVLEAVRGPVKDRSVA